MSTPSRGDVAVAAGLAVVVVAVSGLAATSDVYRPADPLGVTLGVSAALALVLRRTHPVWAIAGTCSAVVVLALLRYDVGVVPWATWIALYSCYAAGTVRERVAGGVLAAAGAAGYVAATPDEPGLSIMTGVVVPTLLAALAGEAVRSRRAYAAEIEARHAALEHAQVLAARQVLLEERARLARELHDAVGHAVNVMVMQAGVAHRVFDANPGYGREALRSIADTGRDALTELDSLLGLLEPEPGGDQHAATPGPSLADLPTLVQRVRDTGRQVDVTARGDVGAVPPRVGRAAYRILQEALTNAVRHADPGAIVVDLAGGPDQLTLEVRNDGGAGGPRTGGRGLVNMAERSRMVGGTFEAGPVPGGFRVRATLPVDGEAT